MSVKSVQAKDRKVAAVLAFVGFMVPGLHKFYLGQPRWGLVYLLLIWTPISKIASLIEGIWYLFQDREEFDRHFNGAQPPGVAGSSVAAVDLPPVSAIADALRQLDALRQDGLISEYEFEQKRRQLLDRVG